MAQKDILSKKLESHPDVFADIFNSLLFKEKLVDSSGLTQLPTEAFTNHSSEIHTSLFRDVIMKYSEKDTENVFGLAILGAENQSSPDELIPIRIMGYDYTQYDNQLKEYKNKKKELYSLIRNTDNPEVLHYLHNELMVSNHFTLTPVITIVLNFNKSPWNTNKSLKDMVKSSQNKFSEWMIDYPVYIFDICNLSREQIGMLGSDFKELAKIFSFGKNSDIRINHLKYPLDTLDFLIAYTNESHYISARNRIALMEEKGEPITMGTLVDELARDTTIENAKRYLKNGCSAAIIIQTLAEELNIAISEAESIFNLEIK